MFGKYVAKNSDFRAVEEAISKIWHPKMDFVFREKKHLESTIVISYDSQHIYLWTTIKLPKLHPTPCSIKNYQIYKIPHNFSISDKNQQTWQAGIPKKIKSFLPTSVKKTSDFIIPKISGGLFTPFITLQKANKSQTNPYTTRQSYMATIVHEFGHTYWDNHKLWWYSNKKENIRFLEVAKRFYENKKTIPKVKLWFPVHRSIGELFASCTEYQASKFFWQKHKCNFDIFATNRLKMLVKSENKKDLDQEDSVLEPNKNPHDFAIVFSKIILTYHPKTWPQKLLNKC